jgi:thioredoxin 1
MPMNKTFAENEPARAEIDALTGPVLVEFGVPWCPHCLGAQPLIEEAFPANSPIQHLKIEDGPGRPLGRSFRVKLWPTLIFMKNGQEISRLVRPTDTAAIKNAMAQIATA